MRPASLFLLLLILPSALEGGSATIQGTVRAKKTNAPLAGVAVQVISMGGALLDTARTDASGSWQALLTTAGIDGGENYVPQQFDLGQSYPNPFNPSTHIPFVVSRNGTVHLTVHNLLGQQLDRRTVQLRAGAYEIEWRSSGSAGVLFYSLECDGRRVTRKMVQLDGGGAGGFGAVSLRGSLSASTIQTYDAPDSVRIVSASLLYEPDTASIPLIDGARADQFLETVHDRAFFVDLHNDVLEQIVASGFTYQIGVRNTVNHTDIPRMRDGGLDAQVLSVWVTTSALNYYANSVKYLDSLKAQIQRNQSSIGIATRPDSITTLNTRGAIAGIVMCEGGECIESDLNKLRDLYARGMRIMTITWNNRPGVPWARAHDAPDAATVGLSAFGRSVIQLMDSLGIVIDVSHAGPKTVDDILSTTAYPIIASHSCSRALKENTRNLTDAQALAIAQGGGVIGVNFYPPFVGIGTVTIDSVIRHIDHFKALVGIDHVAIGSDFDGIGSTPVGLENVTKFPALTEALLSKGYTRDEVRKLLGENFMRVFRTVCH